LRVWGLDVQGVSGGSGVYGAWLWCVGAWCCFRPEWRTLALLASLAEYGARERALY